MGFRDSAIAGDVPRIIGGDSIYMDADKLLGTSFVYDDANRPAQRGELGFLKYDRSGSVPIILVPQPSGSPNDPLVRIPSQDSSPAIASHSD